MSMTIFDAWHIGKPQSIYDLTIMARCVQGIQEETRAADIARRCSFFCLAAVAQKRS